MEDSFHAYKANIRIIVPCNCSGWWMEWGGCGWRNWEFSICYGIILKLLNICLNWPTLSVFTKYIRAIFKSLSANISVSTSASRFDDTYIIRHRDNSLSYDT